MTTDRKWLISGGMVAILTGLFSLLGWIFDHEALVSAVPAIANMTFNTALSFMLLGLTLLLPGSWHPVRLGCAAIVGLFAMLILGQLVFGTSLGIDNLFYNHSTAYPDNPYPGRMAPSTIIAFICSSTAALLLLFGCHKTWSYYTTSLLISATGIASLYRIILNLIYRETHVSLTYQMSMSLMTATGFLAVSIALWALGKTECRFKTSQDIFYPVIRLMFKLSFPRKFILIAIIFSVPLGFSMKYTLESLSNKIAQAQKDKAGIYFLRESSKLVVAMQEHRGMTNARLHGDQSFPAKRIQQSMEKVGELIKNLKVWTHRNNPKQYEIERLAEIEELWDFILANRLNGDIDTLWLAHSNTIKQITRMSIHIGSSLSYTSDANSTFQNISDAVSDHLPQVIELVGQTRGLGVGFIARKQISKIDEYRIFNLSEQMKAQMQKTLTHISDIDETGMLQRKLSQYVSEFKQAILTFDRMTRNAFLTEGTFPFNSKYYFQQGTQVIHTAVKLQSMMLDYQSNTLEQVIERKSENMYQIKSILAISLMLIIFLFIAFYRSIMLMINSLAETAERMKYGDMREPDVKSEDELGYVIQSFNSIASELTRISANMQAIFTCAVDGIITITTKGVITNINPSIENLFGYSREELVGNNITMLMPESYRTRHKTGLAANLAGGKSHIIGQSVEVEGLHKNGSVFPIDLSINTMDVPGEGYLFIGMVHDISGRKGREAAIRRLAAVVEQAVESIIITDAKGIIQYVNPAFEALNGYSKDEAIGLSPNILKSGKEREGFYSELWETIRAGKIWRAQLTNKRKDGSFYDAEHVISPIYNDSGEIIHFVGFQRNITAEKVLQNQMEHAQRLESLGVLAGGIAHDFNNILTAIMGNVALAERRLESDSPAMDFLFQIEDSTQSAASLCKQMLAYSGKGKFELKMINLSELVEDISRLMEVSIKKNVLLRYQIEPSLPAIEADESQLQQVILNLLTNANEAIEDKSGIISVNTGIMYADSEYLYSTLTDPTLPEGRYVYLEVSDTGCGMDTATMKKIFDPFFTTKFAGRGLGMSAVVGIVNSHRGALKVYSEMGRGTTFKILFPVSSKEAFTKPNELNISDHWQGHGTVLIVDDEETIREVAAIMLEDMGFTTLTAEDGEDAVKIYLQHQCEISCVLMDMTMPKMDGKKCFSELRKINPNVLVILSSGYTEQDATPDFIGKDLAGFIQKPYTPEILQNKLQVVFNDNF